MKQVINHGKDGGLLNMGRIFPLMFFGVFIKILEKMAIRMNAYLRLSN